MFAACYVGPTANTLTLVVSLSQNERTQIFDGAPVQTGRVLIDWYDKARNEIGIRRAHPSERGVILAKRDRYQHVRQGGFLKGATDGAKDRIRDYNQIASRSFQAGAGFLDYIFRQTEGTNTRIVKVNGVPHLVCRLPSKEEALAPRGGRAKRFLEKEPLYNPESNPPSPVRQIAPDNAARIGKPAVAPAFVGAKSNKSGGDNIAALRSAIHLVNELGQKVSGAQFSVVGNKIVATVVTRVTL